jgi:hypothetical protein
MHAYIAAADKPHRRSAPRYNISCGLGACVARGSDQHEHGSAQASTPAASQRRDVAKHALPGTAARCRRRSLPREAARAHRRVQLQDEVVAGLAGTEREVDDAVDAELAHAVQAARAQVLAQLQREVARRLAALLDELRANAPCAAGRSSRARPIRAGTNLTLPCLTTRVQHWRELARATLASGAAGE